MPIGNHCWVHVARTLEVISGLRKKLFDTFAENGGNRSVMSEDHYNEFIGKKFIGLSIVLALIVWAAFTYLLTPFTFTTDPFWMYVWAAFTAIPIVGTFFFSVHMFWLVAVEHGRAKKAV